MDHGPLPFDQSIVHPQSIMRLGFTFTQKYPLGDGPEDQEADFEDAQTIEAIRSELAALCSDLIPIPFDGQIIQSLHAAQCDFVFNISEGRSGRNRESYVPALLELMEIPYSGSDPLTLGITHDKTIAKQIARGLGIQTPPFKLVRRLADLEHALPAEFPLFVKPNHEGCSKGIRASSLVHDHHQLETQVQWLLETYQQPVLVEQFIEGREFSAGLLGTENPEIFPVTEIVVQDNGKQVPFYSYEWKDKHAKSLICPADISDLEADELRRMASILYTNFGVRDYGRVDFKADSQGGLHFIEMNALPGLSPDFSIYTQCALTAGYSYRELIEQILSGAMRRTGLRADAG